MNETAKSLALDALVFFAQDQERLGHFLAETGFDPSELRSAAGQPGFTAAMLDYLCSDEALLVAFAAAQNLDPAAVDAARQFLARSNF